MAASGRTVARRRVGAPPAGLLALAMFGSSGGDGADAQQAGKEKPSSSSSSSSSSSPSSSSSSSPSSSSAATGASPPSGQTTSERAEAETTRPASTADREPQAPSTIPAAGTFPTPSATAAAPTTTTAGAGGGGGGGLPKGPADAQYTATENFIRLGVLPTVAISIAAAFVGLYLAAKVIRSRNVRRRKREAGEGGDFRDRPQEGGGLPPPASAAAAAGRADLRVSTAGGGLPPPESPVRAGGASPALATSAEVADAANLRTRTAAG